MPPGEVGDGPGEVADEAVGQAAVVERQAGRRVDLDGRVEIGDRLAVVPAIAVGVARLFRLAAFGLQIEGGGGRMVGDRPVGLLPAVQAGGAAVVVGRPRASGRAAGRRRVGQGLVEVAQVAVDDAAVV